MVEPFLFPGAKGCLALGPSSLTRHRLHRSSIFELLPVLEGLDGEDKDGKEFELDDEDEEDEEEEGEEEEGEDEVCGVSLRSCRW